MKLIPGNNGIILILTRQMYVGASDIDVTEVFTLLYIYIIRCSVVGSSIDGSLNGGISLALAHHGIESRNARLLRVLGVLLGINRAAGHGIEEEFQIRVATLGE